MKLYSYVLVADTGFAPNPHWGYATLATCKPKIRKSAQPGDWVIGTGSVAGVGAGRLVHAMLVDEVVPLDVYGTRPEYAAKQPDPRGDYRKRAGDNIYVKDVDGTWRQRESFHSAEHVKRDVSGENCLIAREFYYFGANAVVLPADLRALANDGHPGHRCRFEPEVIEAFVTWLHANYQPGVHGKPYDSKSCAAQETAECNAASTDSDHETDAVAHVNAATSEKAGKC